MDNKFWGFIFMWILIAFALYAHSIENLSGVIFYGIGAIIMSLIYSYHVLNNTGGKIKWKKIKNK